jgi:hypothetical protein
VQNSATYQSISALAQTQNPYFLQLGLAHLYHTTIYSLMALSLNDFNSHIFICFHLFLFYRPDLVDWRSLKNRGVRDRLDSAFSVVDREYGVTRLLDPEGKFPDFVFKPYYYYMARALLLLIIMMPRQMSINWMLSPSSLAC